MKEKSAEIAIRERGKFSVRGKGIGRGHLELLSALSRKYPGAVTLKEVIEREIPTQQGTTLKN